MRSFHVAALYNQSDQLAAVSREVRALVMASPACRRTGVLLAAKALLSAIYVERVAIDDEIEGLLE